MVLNFLKMKTTVKFKNTRYFPNFLHLRKRNLHRSDCRELGLSSKLSLKFCTFKAYMKNFAFLSYNKFSTKSHLTDNIFLPHPTQRQSSKFFLVPQPGNFLQYDVIEHFPICNVIGGWGGDWKILDLGGRKNIEHVNRNFC